MRKNTLSRIGAALLLAALCLAPGWSFRQASHFHVLLIGIGPYNTAQTAFQPLTGDKDMDNLEAVLKAKYPSAEVEKLNKPGEATKATIIAAVKALAANCEKGDAVYIAFAGHGTQVPDPGQSTRLSQAFVPFDVKTVLNGMDDDVVATSVLTGPEISALMHDLRDKVVDANGLANITLSFDSCHSGSIARGRLRPRAYANPAARRALEQGGATQVPISKQPGIRGLVVLSAALAVQEAMESPIGGGVFTNALVESLNELDPKTGSHGYRTLFRLVESKMAMVMTDKPQTPEITDDAQDRAVFGTQPLETRSSYDVLVTSTKQDPGILHVSIKAGAALGLRNNDIVGVYEPGTEDISKPPLAKGKLMNCGASSAEIVFATPLDNSGKRKLSGKVAIVIDAAPEGRLTVKFDAPAPAGVLQAFASKPYLTVISSGEADVVVKAPTKEIPNWQVLGPDSMHREIAPADFAGAIAETLRQRSCFKAIHDLGASNKVLDFTLEMRILLVKVDGSTNFVGLAQNLDEKVTRPLTSNDNFIVQVRAIPKHGPVNLCIAVLNGTANGTVTQMWPEADKLTASDHTLIANGKWYTLRHDTGLVDGVASDKAGVDIFKCDPEDGQGAEFFKLVATPESVNYKRFLSGDQARGGTEPSNRLALLFSDYSQGQTRAGSEKVSGSWGIAQTAVQFSGK